MSKTVFITSLTKDEAKARDLFQRVHDYGLAANGHFWIDDLDKLAFAGPAEELLKPDAAVWLITGAPEDFAKDSVRRGLALLAALVAGQRGLGLPTFLCPFSGQVDPASLPTPLKSAEAVSSALLGPKLAAAANIPWKPQPAEYRLKIYALPGLGLWFEVGPAAGGAWKGVVFGANGAEVDAHGVGPAGKIPERAVMEHPFKGMKMTAGELEYDAWGASNALAPEVSYYARTTKAPAAILFGELPGEDEGELFGVSFG